MDRDYFCEAMQGEGTTDYEIYLKTQQLFSCQSDFNEFLQW